MSESIESVSKHSVQAALKLQEQRELEVFACLRSVEGRLVLA